MEMENQGEGDYASTKSSSLEMLQTDQGLILSPKIHSNESWQCGATGILSNEDFEALLGPLNLDLLNEGSLIEDISWTEAGLFGDEDHHGQQFKNLAMTDTLVTHSGPLGLETPVSILLCDRSNTHFLLQPETPDITAQGPLAWIPPESGLPNGGSYCTPTSSSVERNQCGLHPISGLPASLDGQVEIMDGGDQLMSPVEMSDGTLMDLPTIDADTYDSSLYAEAAYRKRSKVEGSVRYGSLAVTHRVESYSLVASADKYSTDGILRNTCEQGLANSKEHLRYMEWDPDVPKPSIERDSPSMLLPKSRKNFTSSTPAETGVSVRKRRKLQRSEKALAEELNRTKQDGTGHLSGDIHKTRLRSLVTHLDDLDISLPLSIAVALVFPEQLPATVELIMNSLQLLASTGYPEKLRSHEADARLQIPPQVKDLFEGLEKQLYIDKAFQQGSLEWLARSIQVSNSIDSPNLLLHLFSRASIQQQSSRIYCPLDHLLEKYRTDADFRRALIIYLTAKMSFSDPVECSFLGDDHNMFTTFPTGSFDFESGFTDDENGMNHVNDSTEALLDPIQAEEDEGLGTGGSVSPADQRIDHRKDLDEALRVIDQLRQEIARRADNSYLLQLLQLQTRERPLGRHSEKHSPKIFANNLIRQMRCLMVEQPRSLTKEIAAHQVHSQKQLPATSFTGESINAWKNINYFQCMYPIDCEGGIRFCGVINTAWIRTPKTRYIQRREKCSQCKHKTYPDLRLNINNEVAAMLELERPHWLMVSPKLYGPEEEEQDDGAGTGGHYTGQSRSN